MVVEWGWILHFPWEKKTFLRGFVQYSLCVSRVVKEKVNPDGRGFTLFTFPEGRGWSWDDYILIEYTHWRSEGSFMYILYYICTKYRFIL